MLLSGMLIALFLAGCWLYCLADAVFTPAAQFPLMRKGIWVGLIAVTFIVGGVAWLIAHRLTRGRQREPRSAGRHPALRRQVSRLAGQPDWSGPAVTGPDDDPEFLELLSRRIAGSSDAAELSDPRLLRASPALVVVFHKAITGPR